MDIRNAQRTEAPSAANVADNVAASSGATSSQAHSSAQSNWQDSRSAAYVATPTVPGQAEPIANASQETHTAFEQLVVAPRPGDTTSELINRQWRSTLMPEGNITQAEAHYDVNSSRWMRQFPTFHRCGSHHTTSTSTMTSG